jgi:Zn finger protein HypA/HybF involved in hydrogenase expression
MEEIPAIPAIRKCIRCNKPFKSKSSGHRVCGKCSNEFNRVSQRRIPLTPVPTERDDR